MKKFLAAFLIAVPSALFAQGASIPFVTLDEALRLAELQAPSMRNARNSVRSANLTVTQRYAAFLPSINTSAGIRPAQNGSPANFSANISAGLSALFDYNSYFAIGQAKRQRDVSEAQLVNQRYSVASQVKQQYFAALQSQEALAVSRNAYTVAQAELGRARARVSTGAGIANDTLNATISKTSAEINVINAETAVQNAFRTLSRTLGLESLVQPDPRDTANFQLVSLDSAALEAMLDDSPTARQQRANIENAKFSLRTARFQYLPRPSGSVGYNRGGSGQGAFGFDGKQYRYSGGEVSLSFSFSLPVFNAFGREASLVNAQYSVDNAEITYREQRTAQLHQFWQILAQLRALERTMALQQLQLRASETNLTFFNLRYDLDLITQLDVMNAQNSLFNTRNQIVNTRYQYRNQIAQLEALLGRDIR